MEFSNLKIGFIGSGKISHFHADVLKHLQCEIRAVATLPNAPDLQLFVDKYDIKNIYFDYLEMVNKEDLDAIFVTASWNAIDGMLDELLSLDIPLFLEKPVALTSTKLQKMLDKYGDMHSNVQVGYNRRFYDFVEDVKNDISCEQVKSIEMIIPESTKGRENSNILKHLFLQNSSHVVDLMYYLLDEPTLTVEYMKRFSSENGEYPAGYNGMLLANNLVPVYLNANWNCPANFGIKINAGEKLYELLPIETARVYKGFDVIEPSREVPIRRYLPKKIKEYPLNDLNNSFKPGFFQQSVNFLKTCVLGNADNKVAATLKSSYMITKICEDIMGL